MRNSDITLVFQGSFKPYVTRDGDAHCHNIHTARLVLPGARIILSTWEGTDVPADLAVDDVIFSPDPGGLAPMRVDLGESNSVNRQLVSTHAGLAAVRTPFSVKIRTDCTLRHAGFLDFHAEQLKRDRGRERVLACSFFTLDPTVFGRIPYHLSDWFHFGSTDLLRAYWSAPPVSVEQAQFYDTHAHIAGSSIFEQRFRSKFAAEQHVCAHFARLLGYTCPRFLNDAAQDVMRDYHRFLAQEVMLLDPWQIGLEFRKYDWVGNSQFQCMNNLMHLDWLRIAGQKESGSADFMTLRRQIQERIRKKQVVRTGFRFTRSLHPLIFDTRRGGDRLRQAATRVLQLL